MAESRFARIALRYTARLWPGRVGHFASELPTFSNMQTSLLPLWCLRLRLRRGRCTGLCRTIQPDLLKSVVVPRLPSGLSMSPPGMQSAKIMSFFEPCLRGQLPMTMLVFPQELLHASI